MKTLHIGGNLVQTGEKESDLTLLNDQKRLRSLSYYHSWVVNGETLQDTEEIINLSDDDLYEHEYFDGTKTNILMIKGGLTKTEKSLKQKNL
jgi:hypothetical protein